MAMLIRHLGHEAHALFAGAEVASFLKQQDVDLIIMDIMMPGISGMDVLRSLRGESKLRTPIIMMTAITDPLTRREAMELGANDYWVKASVDVSDLERRIAKHVRADDAPPPASARSDVQRATVTPLWRNVAFAMVQAPVMAI